MFRMYTLFVPVCGRYLQFRIWILFVLICGSYALSYAFIIYYPKSFLLYLVISTFNMKVDHHWVPDLFISNKNKSGLTRNWSGFCFLNTKVTSMVSNIGRFRYRSTVSYQFFFCTNTILKPYNISRYEGLYSW